MNDELCNRLIRDADIWDWEQIRRGHLNVLIKLVVLESIDIIRMC
jgi:hypothetical protein